MKHTAMAIMSAVATLPQSLLAHGGLDHGSLTMAFLHALAHAINDHPIIMALLGAAVVIGLGLYQRRRVGRRASP
ncbi:MAG TPA: hypothetical protein VI566_13050 [Xanthomonadales bacterium]|nr:hypothetical protein [Xanthomonadales bacterium]